MVSPSLPAAPATAAVTRAPPDDTDSAAAAAATTTASTTKPLEEDGAGAGDLGRLAHHPPPFAWTRRFDDVPDP